MPTLEDLTGAEVEVSLPKMLPCPADAEEADPDSEVESVTDDPELRGVPAIMGKLGLIMDMRVLMLSSGFWYRFDIGVCKSRLSWSTSDAGT
jgi:hypothetical protein